MQNNNGAVQRQSSLWSPHRQHHYRESPVCVGMFPGVIPKLGKGGTLLCLALGMGRNGGWQKKWGFSPGFMSPTSLISPSEQLMSRETRGVLAFIFGKRELRWSGSMDRNFHSYFIILITFKDSARKRCNTLRNPSPLL